jgi:hypothetical protein
MKLIILLLCCCVSSITFSQNSIDSVNFNRAIHKSWGGDKIRFFAQQNPEYIKKGLYYFNHSFEVNLKDCPTCDVDLYNLINLELFNVSEFEANRKADERFQFTYKDYVISLHSKQELENYLGESIPSFTSGSSYTTFPEFDFEDMSAQKLEQYSSSCSFYIQNYKTNYRERILAPNYRFILLEEIKDLSQEEIDSLVENPLSFEVKLN